MFIAKQNEIITKTVEMYNAITTDSNTANQHKYNNRLVPPVR